MDDKNANAPQLKECRWHSARDVLERKKKVSNEFIYKQIKITQNFVLMVNWIRKLVVISIETIILSASTDVGENHHLTDSWGIFHQSF